MALPKGAAQWLELALVVLPLYVSSEGAVIWPEAEARLGETDWMTQHYDPTIPSRYGIDPHMLHRARSLLALRDVIRPDTAVLNGRQVTAWIDVAGLDDRRTEIERVAATKRRLYRRFLGWAGNADLCGRVGEELVHASLESLTGRYLWLDPDQRPGNVRSVIGRPLTVGGPLDASGYCATDPSNPLAGFVPFAIEVKNVRSVLYPWHREVWDLLAKLADFPDVVPILVARRIHHTTFRCFKDIGALGCGTLRQWFHSRETARSSIDPAAFAEVCNRFAFHDAVLVDDPNEPQPAVTKFFRETIRIETARGPLIAAQAERWGQAAEIARDFVALRDEDLSQQDRRELWREFGNRIKAAGMYEQGRWAPNGTDVEP
jgi:hypothetical protein